MIPILALLLGTFVVVLGIEKVIALAALFVMTGAAHFIVTEPMAQMVPPPLPPVATVWGTGVLEIFGAIGLSRAAHVEARRVVPVRVSDRGFPREHLRGNESHRPRRAPGWPLLFVAARSVSATASRMDVGFRNPKEGSPMKPGGKVSIDIADGSQSVTETVNQLLGDDTTIAPEDVRLLDNGWVQLKRGGNNLYISPHAVESVLVEDGELP